MPIAWGEPFSFDQTLPQKELGGAEQRDTHSRVLILGAGLAGLGCAYRYVKTLGRPAAAEDVRVIEREASVGGRVRSLKIGSQVMDLGAVTFQPTAYPRYMALLDEMGLRERVRIIPRRTMVLGIDGRAVHADNLALATNGIASLVGRGLFTPREGIELIRFYFYMRRVTTAAHFDELLALQDRSVADWARQFGFSEGVRRKFIEPFIGFTFSAPEQIAASFGVLLLGFNLSKPANLAGGMMTLPEALAERLKGLVETGVTAVRVQREADGFVTECVDRNGTRRIHSQYLVAAVPANVAAGLVPEMRERASTVAYGNGQATLLEGHLRVRGELHLWRAEGEQGTVIYGGEAQATENGGHLINVLTYRGERGADLTAKLFVDGQYNELLRYAICPAVAAPAPKQKPLPLEWGDRLYMAGDCTGLFPSQETALSSGEQVADLITRHG